MRKAPSTVVRAVAVAIALTSLAVPSALAQEQPQGGWEYDLTIYGWLPSVDGELKYDLPSVGDSITVDAGTLVDSLQFAAMAAFSATNDRWSMLGDVIYLGVGGSEDTLLDIGPGVEVGADLELDGWAVSLGGAYEVARSRRSTLGVMVGLRCFDIETDLSLGTGGPLVDDVSVRSSSTLWNGVAGVRGRLGLAERWFVPYHLDVGTGDSDLTWQAMAGIGCDFKWGSLFVAYRHLDFDQGDSGAVKALSFSGGAVAARFRF